MIPEQNIEQSSGVASPELFKTRVRRNINLSWARLFDQVGTLLLSVILGLIVWLVAIDQVNPLEIREFSDTIVVDMRGLTGELEPVSDNAQDTIQVIVQGPKRSLELLNGGSFDAYIDLSTLARGQHTVPVEVIVDDPQIKIVEYFPQQLQVQLDTIITRTLPVQIKIMDSAGVGYTWQEPVIDPQEVVVRGPATQIGTVQAVRAEVYLLEAKKQVERMQAVVPLTDAQEIVENVEAEPAVVNVRVPVEQLPGRKEVAVRVNLEGQPAIGYRLSTVRINPSTVVLTGSNDALAQVPGFVSTAPISLKDATGEISEWVDLILPEGVEVSDVARVSVTASIATIEGGSTVKQKPVPRGLGEGLQATVLLETVEVILSGPLPLLESLGSDDIFVLLPLEGLLAGNHVIEPILALPDGIRSDGVIPETIEVVISPTSIPANSLEEPGPAVQDTEQSVDQETE